MQGVPCAARYTINEMCPDDSTLTLRTDAGTLGMHSVYELDVKRTMSITYFGGPQWIKFLIEYYLQKGDAVSIDYSKHGHIYANGFRYAGGMPRTRSEGNLICLYSSYPLIITVFQVTILSHSVCCSRFV